MTWSRYETHVPVYLLANINKIRQASLYDRANGIIESSLVVRDFLFRLQFAISVLFT
jgi:hypothetical protein